ncbi:MAG: hypothetical protein EPO64_00475 [Nitrospirae bacterium]|nr:MAG: hypothetical protein EPO64_00475 [Nitrospirota bacterium]
MSENGLFPSNYEEFLKSRGKAKGYEFQHAPSGSVAPPTVTFSDKLRWWTLDRWKRMKQIRAERDRQQSDIVHLAQSPRRKP